MATITPPSQMGVNSNKSCQVSYSIQGNSATAELRSLINKVNEYYGGDDSEFLTAYIKEMLAQHPIADALICF